jgi:hypothetical protein
VARSDFARPHCRALRYTRRSPDRLDRPQSAFFTDDFVISFKSVDADGILQESLPADGLVIEDLVILDPSGKTISEAQLAALAAAEKPEGASA